MIPDRDSKQYYIIRLEGYRARVANIPRERNWYTLVRPCTTDEVAWFEGWDLANKDLNK